MLSESDIKNAYNKIENPYRENDITQVPLVNILINRELDRDNKKELANLMQKYFINLVTELHMTEDMSDGIVMKTCLLKEYKSLYDAGILLDGIDMEKFSPKNIESYIYKELDSLR